MPWFLLPSTQPVATLGSSFIWSSFGMACTCCVPCVRRGYCFWCWHEHWLWHMIVMMMGARARGTMQNILPGRNSFGVGFVLSGATENTCLRQHRILNFTFSSVQFSTLDARDRGYLAWTSLGIIYFFDFVGIFFFFDHYLIYDSYKWQNKMSPMSSLIKFR